MNDLARTLTSATAGDSQSHAQLQVVLYEELRGVAARILRGERPDHTLQPTALVHEAYLRLVPQEPTAAERTVFFGAAAQTMRRILVDHARRRNSQKRGEGQIHVDVDDESPAAPFPPAEILDLHDALDRLAEKNERMARVVELRFFGGLTLPEIAEVVGTSRTTAANDWAFARTWLHRELS